MSTLRIGTVEEIYNFVEARIRIESIHGKAGEADALRTQDLPIAKPCVPPVVTGERYDANIKVGDKLYVMECEDFYLYLGKVYTYAESTKDYELYAENKNKIEDNNVAFGGFRVSASENTLEILSAKKSGSSLSDYCGIKLDSQNGSIELIVKKGGNKAVIELNAGGGVILRYMNGSTIVSELELKDGIELQTTGLMYMMASWIRQKYPAPVGSDGREWKGKVI